MPSILHRLSVDAAPEHVHELISTTEGISKWWTGRPVAGNDGQGGKLSVYFGDIPEAAATFEVTRSDRDQVVWTCLEGPQDWLGTSIVFVPKRSAGGGTTLLFRHEGWDQENEFMSACSTNWAAYLMSLKSGAEGRGFTPFPGGEVSRWD